ncbi:MAG: hypothetical protein B5M46_01285 [Epsilonproteobacteria bacterium 4484_20]|nr:MAG: hypothetical protein B5M46_01285 [Epsilonproteobacteria bacterium 4484_20]
MKLKLLFLPLAVSLFFTGCTQETQNSLSRSLQNWTGTNGVLDIYAGDKLVYGVDDVNFNGQVDPGEKKVYFEFSDYSTSYIFYERNDK